MKQEPAARHDEGTERRRTTMKRNDMKRQWNEKIKAAIEEARWKRPEQVGVRPRRVFTFPPRPGKDETTEMRHTTMSKKDRMQNWTQKEIQAAIAKSLENEPDGPNKEYWTTADCTLQQIRKKYRLPKFKPSPLKIVLTRKCCGKEFAHVLKYKRDAKNLTDWKCFAPECRLKVTVIPFGKFKGQTLPWVYERSPSYLAWFCETVWGCEDVKEAIMGMEGMETLIAEYRQHKEGLEWRTGQFSPQTVDTVCDELFGGEG
jgi:hypothetical protein